MENPPLLSHETLVVILPYIMAMGRATAERIGEGVGDQFRAVAAKLYDRVKRKSATDPEAAVDLAKLEQDPASRGRQIVMEERLAEFISRDPEFAQQLEELVGDAKRAGGDTFIQTVTVSQGTVGTITQIGKVDGGN